MASVGTIEFTKVTNGVAIHIVIAGQTLAETLPPPAPVEPPADDEVPDDIEEPATPEEGEP